MTPAERQARGERAKRAMEEFFGPAFDHIERDRLEALLKSAVSSDPRGSDVQARLSAQIQAVRTVRGEIEAFIHDGTLAEVEMKRDGQIAQMSPFKRSVVGV